MRRKKKKTKEVDQIDSETRNILNIARTNAPIDTSGLFAYGVLDKGRTKDKVHVGYYNESVYKIYEFNHVDSTWKKGENLKSTVMSKNKGGGEGYVIQDYNGVIAQIYHEGTAPEHSRDTLYVPGNHQSDGTWNITRQYVTDKPTYAQFIEGTEIESSTNSEHNINWVGPWKYCREIEGEEQCEQSDNHDTYTQIKDSDNVFHNASELTVTYEHEIITINPPTMPQLDSPTDQSIENTTVNYSWQVSSGEGNITYQLQVDDNSSFSSPFFNQSNISSTSKSVLAHDHGSEYYWRVRVSNVAGNSSWSSVRSLTIRPEKVPNLSAYVSNGHPKLNWNSAEGAASYDIYKKTDSSGEWNIYSSTSSTSFTDQYANVDQYQGLNAGSAPYVGYYVVSVSQGGIESGASNSHYLGLDGITPHDEIRNSK